MAKAETTFYFDFVDPLSYLMELEIASLGSEVDAHVERVGLELRPPPSPLVLIDDDSLTLRWSTARDLAEARGVELVPPRLVPWTRKALELHLHAAEAELAAAVRQAIYEAYHARGLDIGRIDVLVQIARSAGLDATRAKAVLDVDRFEAQVSHTREVARGARILEPPVIVRGAARLEGFHNRTALGTFLATTSDTSGS